MRAWAGRWARTGMRWNWPCGPAAGSAHPCCSPPPVMITIPGSGRTDPKIGPQLGARQQAQAVAGGAGACGAVWSGGLGLACSVWLGFGDAAQGDFEAEGAELADVVSDLPAGVALALVVV